MPADVTAGEELRTIAEALYQINQNMQMYEKAPANETAGRRPRRRPSRPTWPSGSTRSTTPGNR